MHSLRRKRKRKKLGWGLGQGIEGGWCDCVIHWIFVLSSFLLPEKIVHTESSAKLLGHVQALLGWYWYWCWWYMCASVRVCIFYLTLLILHSQLKLGVRAFPSSVWENWTHSPLSVTDVILIKSWAYQEKEVKINVKHLFWKNVRGNYV